MRRGDDGLHDARGALGAVPPDVARQVLRRAAGVGGDALAVLAGEHPAAQRSPGEQPEPVVTCGRPGVPSTTEPRSARAAGTESMRTSRWRAWAMV